MTACSMHIKTTRVTSQSYWLPSSPLSQFVTNLVTLFRPLGCDVIYGRSYMSGEQGITEWCWQVILIIACCHSGRLAHLLLEHFYRNTKNTLLVFRMTNTWKSPEMNIYLDFDLKLAAFQYIDGFVYCHFCLNRFRLELMIFFWTSSQLLVQCWYCRLLELSVQFWDCRLTIYCNHRHVGSHLLQAQCCVDLSQPKKESNKQSPA